MGKKPNGRFLLTWNEKKHPEVTAFFEEIEEGLYSHTLRDVIKLYMQQKESGNSLNTSKEHFNGDTHVKSVEGNSITSKDEGNDKYVDFDPDTL